MQKNDFQPKCKFAVYKLILNKSSIHIAKNNIFKYSCFT